jgi:phosphoribosylanthranilate isomerase
VSINQEIKDLTPQVKICGLTSVDEAVACAALGADAIGLVFYPKSPRYVTAVQAEEISRALPLTVCTVGVFVDETFDNIMRTARSVRLNAIQLHGTESPQLMEKICHEGLTVIKALFSHRKPFYSEASYFPATAFLVECGDGLMPGGNARAWDFSLMKGFGKHFPLVLAGGLTLNNIIEAVVQSQPDAVDVSSGVERLPGQKDLSKVKTFINNVQRARLAKPNRRIFYVHD